LLHLQQAENYHFKKVFRRIYKYFFRNLEKQEIKEKSFKIWYGFYQSDDNLNNSTDINKTVESLMKAFLEYHSDKDIKPNILFYVVDEEEYVTIKVPLQS
jgi:hypothetical protein